MIKFVHILNKNELHKTPQQSFVGVFITNCEALRVDKINNVLSSFTQNTPGKQ